MSKKLKVLASVAIAAVALMSVVSCAGPAGPAGSAGAAGSGTGAVVPAITDFTTLGGVQAFLPNFISNGQLNQGQLIGFNGFLGINAYTYNSYPAAETVQLNYKSIATIVADSTTPGGYAVQVRAHNLSAGTSVEWAKFFSGITTDALYKVTASIQRLTPVTAAATTAGTELEFQADAYTSSTIGTDGKPVGEFNGQPFAKNGFTKITFPTTADTAYANYVTYATGFSASNPNLWIGFFADQQPLNYNIGSVTLTTVPKVGADQDWVNAAVAQFHLNGQRSAVTTNANLTLPATYTPSAPAVGNAVNIAWASSNDAIVDHTTGNVTTLATAAQSATLTATFSYGTATPAQVVFTITVPQAYSIVNSGDTLSFPLGIVPQATGITGAAIGTWESNGSTITLTQAANGWTFTDPRKTDGSGDLAWAGFSLTFAKVFLAGHYDIEVDIVGSPSLFTGLVAGDVATPTITSIASGKILVSNYDLATNGPIFIGKTNANGLNWGTNFLGDVGGPDATITISKVIVTVH